MFYVTSDPHFGHENIIKLCKRPFKDLREMDNTIIENYNNTVSSKDTTFIIGDFAYKSNYINYIKKLNGIKILIRGNHDDRIPNQDIHFKEIHNYLEYNYKDYLFIMFHYPIHEWKGFFRNNTIHLHGHNHVGKQKYDIDPWFKDKHIYNVCQDMNEFKPLSLDEIINKFYKKE
jgi:calcineurin-like phosphoesterase family protein